MINHEKTKKKTTSVGNKYLRGQLTNLRLN